MGSCLDSGRKGSGLFVCYAGRLESSGGWNPHLMEIRMKAGARPERLTYAGENIFELAISPRGNRFAYTQELTDADLLELRTGKDSRSFASSRRSDYYPQY